MTSDSAQSKGAFVWIWLPGKADPVVAGRLVQGQDRFVFNYGGSYLARSDAIPIYEPELPLGRGLIEPPAGLSMARSIRDGSPDAWGRRVIINRLTGAKAAEAADFSELTFLLESGSDHIGALDFQESATNYVPRLKANAPCEELLEAAAMIEKGVPLTPALDLALNHGTSIGGARPKALIDDGDRKLIAKFSASADIYSVVKAEFIAMKLASASGRRQTGARTSRASWYRLSDGAAHHRYGDQAHSGHASLHDLSDRRSRGEWLCACGEGYQVRRRAVRSELRAAERRCRCPGPHGQAASQEKR